MRVASGAGKSVIWASPCSGPAACGRPDTIIRCSGGLAATPEPEPVDTQNAADPGLAERPTRCRQRKSTGKPDRLGRDGAGPLRTRDTGPCATAMAPAPVAVLDPGARRPPDRLAAAAVADVVGAVDRGRRPAAAVDPVRVQRR